MGCACSFNHDLKMKSFFNSKQIFYLKEIEIRKLLQLNKRKVPILENINESLIMVRRNSYNSSFDKSSRETRNQRELLLNGREFKKRA